MLKNVDINREHITTPEAAKKSGLSRIYIARLLREGTLEGFQLAREWFVYTDSLDKFLATPRKSGPKGPIGKRSREQTETTHDTKKNNK